MGDDQPMWMRALGAMLDAGADDGPNDSGVTGDKDALLKLGLIAEGEGIKSDGSKGAPQAHVDAHEPLWEALLDSLDEPLWDRLETECQGAAGAHSHAARMEIARKLIINHEAVLYDVTHPQPRTQHNLERVSESLRPYADQALFECARRLLGLRPGFEAMEIQCDLADPTQGSVWGMVWRFFDGRVHGTPEQKPDRKPDMSPEAAAAMKDVLKEIGHEGLTRALAHSAPHWAMMQRSLDEGGMLTTIAEGAAAAFTHAVREAAARKLIGNHENVLRDVVNPSRTHNIDAKALTQLELTRVDVGCAMYADQALREVARRLLGRRAGLHQLEVRMDPANEAQAAAWLGVSHYLHGRIQAADNEMPGRTPDLSPLAANAMKAVLREVARPPPRSHGWEGLEALAESGAGFSSVADGAAASFAHIARQEAASRLIGNHARVLRDVCNPSRTMNIENKPLTQTLLERVDHECTEYADQVLREVCRRLLGRRSGSRSLEERLDPSNHVQAAAWAATAKYLDGRIQANPEQKPGRTPDMSPAAAAAMRAVLGEIGYSPISATAADSAPHWAMLHKVLETGGLLSSEADGVAAVHTHAAREAAARKLIGNHENVLRDVANPSRTHNIDAIPLTQLELKRVPVGHAYYADQALREVARRLLGRRAGLHQLEVRMDPANEAQAAAWHGVAQYLDGRIQDRPEQKPGRTPDFPPLAGAAMRAVVAEVGSAAIKATIEETAPYWVMLRRVLESEEEEGAEAGDDPVAPQLADPAIRDEAARLLLDYREVILWEAANSTATFFDKPAGRVELPRVDVGSIFYAEQALREVCRTLLGGRRGTEMLKEEMDPHNESQVQAWATTVLFVHHHVLPALTTSEAVSACVCAALYRVGGLASKSARDSYSRRSVAQGGGAPAMGKSPPSARRGSNLVPQPPMEFAPKGDSPAAQLTMVSQTPSYADAGFRGPNGYGSSPRSPRSPRVPR